jgi:hypothetical protein
MAAQVGALFVSLTGDTSKLVGSFRTGEKSIDTFGRKVDRRLLTTEGRMKALGVRAGALGASLGRSFKGNALGILGGFGLSAGGVAGIVGSLATVANSVAAIGDEAARAGVSAQALQEWKFVAEQARIPLDSMVDALKELNIRADEFATTGKGSAAEAFARLGLTPAEVKERLQDPSAFMLELIERTRRLGDTAAGVRVFDELFGGTGGERLVSLLSQSDAELRATIKSAHDLGLVMSDDLIEKAAELDRKFNLVKNTVGTGLKTAIVEAAAALGEFIDSFRDLEKRTSLPGLMETLDEIAARRDAVNDQIERLQSAPTGTIIAREAAPAIAELREQLIGLDREASAVLNRIGELNQQSSPRTSPGFTPAPYTPPAPPKDGAARAAEREREAVQKLITALQTELALIGALDVDKEVANNLRRAGAAATDEERVQIEALTRVLYENEAAHKRATDAAEFFGGAAFSAIDDLLLNAKSLTDVLGDIAKLLARAALEAALLGSGPMANLFGGGGGSGIIGSIAGLFAPGGGGGLVSPSVGLFNQGGPVKPLRLAPGGHVTGPGGPTGDKIPAMLSDGEFVTNARSTARFRPLLEMINSGVANFARGGPVGTFGMAGTPLVGEAREFPRVRLL